MLIKYSFVTGETTTVEVSDEIGTVIIDSRRKEENLARKERYHCYSLDALEYEGKEFADRCTPDNILEDRQAKERLEFAIAHLSDVQKRRFQLYADGYSINEIARLEEVNPNAVMKSIAGARKKLKKFF